MQIGIDARLNAYREGGIAQYTRLLLASMAAQAPTERFILLQHYRKRQPIVHAPNVWCATLVTPPHHRYEQWSLPVELWPRRLDLLHCPDFIAPRWRPCPAVITIHDLAFLHFPEILDRAARRFYGQIRTAAHDAEAVITVSESTRTDIIQLLDLPPSRITVIYEAADPGFAPLAGARQEQRTIDGHLLRGDRFLLFVSTIEPRKNLDTLLRALRVCLDRRPNAGYQLVVAGRPGWLAEPIYSLMRELRLGDALILLGAIGHDDLRWLYSACRLYLNPSRYEGFGLPLLEAMACAAPALIADNSSLPEVAGGAAVCLPTTDVEAWADSIATLWSDPVARDELGRRGPPRAAQFSWERAAHETLALYRRVAGHG